MNARSDRVFADVPNEALEIGDLRGRPALAVRPFGDVIAGRGGRASAIEINVCESVGTAVLDAAAAESVFERAREIGSGTTITL